MPAKSRSHPWTHRSGFMCLKIDYEFILGDNNKLTAISITAISVSFLALRDYLLILNGK